MSPEERFTKIENAIHALTEVQAKHDEAIRNLITVSRTLVDSQMRTDIHIKETDVHIKETVELHKIWVEEQRRSHQDLAAAQRHTDERLNALIEIVDRLFPR
jgi:hypothetical protein